MSGTVQRFLASELAPAAPGDCRFHIIPVPYEGTVSYGGGTARGPVAMLEASQQLEVWTGESNPAAQGIYTWPAVDCGGTVREVLARVEDAVGAVLRSGADEPLPGAADEPETGRRPITRLKPSVLPILFGGEHSISLGAFRALQARYGSFGIVHFDAHADLRDSYGGSAYSHACVMRRAVDDLGLSLFQIGVRSLSAEEAQYRSAKGIGHIDARQAAFPCAWQSCFSCPEGAQSPWEPLSALLPVDFPDLVYLSFDIDALDASLMPATGTPEPGGLFWWDALRLVRLSLEKRVCIGFDVVELAPVAGMHAPDYTAARLAYEIMGLLA